MDLTGSRLQRLFNQPASNTNFRKPVYRSGHAAGRAHGRALTPPSSVLRIQYVLNTSFNPWPRTGTWTGSCPCVSGPLASEASRSHTGTQAHTGSGGSPTPAGLAASARPAVERPGSAPAASARVSGGWACLTEVTQPWCWVSGEELPRAPAPPHPTQLPVPTHDHGQAPPRNPGCYHQFS